MGSCEERECLKFNMGIESNENDSVLGSFGRVYYLSEICKERGRGKNGILIG